MTSFFEKLKKGMGIDESEGIEEEVEETENTEEPINSSQDSLQVKAVTEKKQAKKKTSRPKKIIIGDSKDPSPASLKSRSAVEDPEISSPASLQEKAEEKILETEIEEKTLPLAPDENEELKVKKDTETKEEWFEPEGELAIDVYQTEGELIIQSAIAGVKPEDLDISMERDVIAIKGIRQNPFKEEGDYFTQECYWGPFSREIILPTEVDPERIEAVMKDGILTIRIPKIMREKLRKIRVKI